MAQAQSIFIPYVGASDLAALDYWTANDCIFPANVPGDSEGRNDHPVIVYPKDEDNPCYFSGIMGKDYGGGIITLEIYWASPEIVGNVVWFVAWERDNAGPAGVNLDVAAFGAEKSVVSAVQPVTGNLSKATLFFNKVEAAGVEPGDPFRIRVRRDAGVLLDTLNGNAQWYVMSKEALP
jgi:hypothetical protein